MSRYIDADAFEAFGYNKTEGASEEYNDGFDDGVQYVLECIDNVPTADVVEVVRCKDCVHYQPSLFGEKNMCFRKDVDGVQICYDFSPDDYCSYGERREDGSD